MHRPLRYLFWFVRLPTPTSTIPWLIKKEKSPLVSLVTRRPTALPPPDGRRRSSLPAEATLLPRRRRWRSFLAGDGGAPPSPVALPLTAASHLQRSFASSASARRGMSPGVTATIVVLSLVLVALAAAGAYWGYRMWEKRKRKRAGMEQELVPGPYKDLKSMASSNSSFKT